MTPIPTPAQARGHLGSATRRGGDVTRARAVLAAATVAESMDRHLATGAVPDDLAEALTARLAESVTPLDDPYALAALADRYRAIAERLDLDALAALMDAEDAVEVPA